MRIIQTFWTGNSAVENPLSLTGGWLSAEYQWMSWALSCLQLKKHYGEVFVFTDSVGEQILSQKLNLPYTSVSTQLDAIQHNPPELWALSKIYTYSLQSEPFLHVDGDIYIWKKFDKTIEEAELIAQNLEVNFGYYYDTLGEIKKHFSYIPDCMQQEIRANPIIRSCNTGLIGGKTLPIFAEYAELAVNLIRRNQEHLPNIDRRTFNIGFEQFLYYSLAQQHQIPLTCYIDREEDFDPTYKGFARFECVPYQTTFIHALGEFKRQEETCQHLAKRLRQDYPETYYHILRICQESGLTFHHKAYTLRELSPAHCTAADYEGLKKAYLSGTLTNDESMNWLYYYAKDMAVYEQVEQLFSLPEHQLLAEQLQFDTDCQIIEVNEPHFQQTLLVPDIHTLTIKELELDSLNMVLLDAFLQEKPIEQAIQEVAVYFHSPDSQTNAVMFQQLVLDRLKELIYLGAVKKVAMPSSFPIAFLNELSNEVISESR